METEPELLKKPKLAISPNSNEGKDFLLRLEAYLARRDGIDKLLKICRYAAKIAIACSIPNEFFSPRLKAFESSVGLSRKAFRLGKFIQDVNALRVVSGRSISTADILLSVAAYGGEGVYYFMEQIFWLSKAGILTPDLSRRFQKISAWAELIGFVGSITLKVKEVRKIGLTIELFRICTVSKDYNDGEIRALRQKLILKRLSLVQDVADVLMFIGDVIDDKGGFLTDPLLMASAGMISALISAHKNWISC